MSVTEGTHLSNQKSPTPATERPKAPAGSEATDKATIFTSRRECLIASASDSRSVWSVSVKSGADDPSRVFWGLARTEHQFRMAVANKLMWIVEKLTKDQIQAAMADEMKAMAKGGES